jgi:glycosyltransferase involved in cell wall biosynthesis
MRLLVGLHHLELGGSQLNALDLAVACRERDNEVTVFATYEDSPGPVADKVRAAGLPLILLRHSRVRHGLPPARRAVTRALSRIVAQERIQLVHAYEYPLTLDAFYGPHLAHGIPLVSTIYGQDVPRWLPRYPPLIVGTRELADMAAPLRTQPPVLIRPPVNTDADSPALVDGPAFRKANGLDAAIVVGVVSRLEPEMKADGIKLAIAAILAMDNPRIQLLVTGDGPSFVSLNGAAERANSALGRRAVVMTGPLTDPRPAYAAADIALGMGGSALRAMAFGKPLIVLGVRGFAKPFLPATAAEFLTGGFYGIGSGDLNPLPLASHLKELADRPALRSELGAFGSRLVVERFSLKAASDTLDGVYAAAITQQYPHTSRLREAARVAAHRTGSQLLPAAAKDRLRPVVRPFLHRSGAPSPG